jgi:hypothetical protein
MSLANLFGCHPPDHFDLSNLRSVSGAFRIVKAAKTTELPPRMFIGSMIGSHH